MTTLREAAQQALDAVEHHGGHLPWNAFVEVRKDLKDALEQPESELEPVAWMQKSTGVVRTDWHFDKSGYVPLYAVPPEPDYRSMYLKVRDELAALQQRKPLTNAEIEELMDLYDVTSIDFVRAIEAAHGIGSDK